MAKFLLLFFITLTLMCVAVGCVRYGYENVKRSAKEDFSFHQEGGGQSNDAVSQLGDGQTINADGWGKDIVVINQDSQPKLDSLINADSSAPDYTITKANYNCANAATIDLAKIATQGYVDIYVETAGATISASDACGAKSQANYVIKIINTPSSVFAFCYGQGEMIVISDFNNTDTCKTNPTLGYVEKCGLPPQLGGTVSTSAGTNYLYVCRAPQAGPAILRFK